MEADVAVIGFGPVGAVLAGLLGKYGVRVVVIEKDEAVFPLPRAAHVDHTGLRTIQELGCLDSLLPKMVRNKRLDLLDARRQVLATLGQDKFTVHKLFEEVALRYAERPGGYTRIVKLGPRRSDSTEMVFLEFV